MWLGDTVGIVEVQRSDGTPDWLRKEGLASAPHLECDEQLLLKLEEKRHTVIRWLFFLATAPVCLCFYLFVKVILTVHLSHSCR